MRSRRRAARAPRRPAPTAAREGRKDARTGVEEEDARLARDRSCGTRPPVSGGRVLRSGPPARRRSAPAPTIANVSHAARRSGSVDPLRHLERAEDLAAQVAARRRSTSSRARGARAAGCRSTTSPCRRRGSASRSRPGAASPSGRCTSSVRASASIAVTSPSSIGGVGLPAQHLARRRRDLPGREDPGRDLVEERLEEVMVGRGDQRHGDRRAPQRLGGVEAAEPGADDDHAVHLLI